MRPPRLNSSGFSGFGRDIRASEKREERKVRAENGSAYTFM